MAIGLIIVQFITYCARSCKTCILVPRGRAPFGQHQESRPVAKSNDIPFLNGFVNTIDWVQSQSDLSDLTLNMRRVTGSPWIADFRCWTWPEVAILGADQKEHGLWGREWQDMAFEFACAVTMRRSNLRELRLSHCRCFIANVTCSCTISSSCLSTLSSVLFHRKASDWPQRQGHSR